MALEPWLVEAALARLCRTLSPADQRTIVKAAQFWMPIESPGSGVFAPPLRPPDLVGCTSA
jgi:hypothetical protein